MGSKKFFDKQREGKNLRGLSKKTISQFANDVESQRYIEEYARSRDQFIPDADYSNPENFVKYGLAEQYYSDAITRIYGQYPYDGSKAERLEFYNNLTPLEKYIFDERYPKTTGYARFSPSGWGTVTALGNPATKEYITFYGSRKDGVYNTSSAQENSLKLDYSGSGNTVEFWLKKDGWTDKDEVTRFETIFDLRTTASVTNAGHRQFEIYLDGNNSTTKTQINVTDRADGTSAGGDVSIISTALDTGLSDIADSKWHHYAVVVKKNDYNNFITSSLYVDGIYADVNVTNSYGTGALANWAGFGDAGAQTAIATLGAAATNRIGDDDAYGTGWFKVTGSIDEFRFWKSARTAEQIGRNYFCPVYGGANTDSTKFYYSSSVDYNKVDLGVYFKFNEGIVGDSGTDATVLDYSGRISNGTWTGYSAASRSTSSAIVESGVVGAEELDPILYSTHDKITALSTELAFSGSEHDMANIGALYNSIPQWIREEDEEGAELKKLTQIVGSYLDTLYGQISYFTNIKEASYITGSVKQSSTVSKDLLRSQGFEISDIFIDADVIQEVFSRDEKRIYEEKLENIKNLIYKNIYNNLNYINKSKGTEKAFRNLFRCFGTDDELFKLNVYSNNTEHEIESNYEITSTKRHAIDFSGLKRLGDREATIYQHPGTGSGDYGYISGSYGDRDIPITVEAQVLFPKFPKQADYAAVDRLDESSLFGCHKVDHAHTSDSTAFASVDRDFQVSAVKVGEDRTYFKLSSINDFFPTLTSSMFYDVYNNSVWNFAVRIKPEQYPWSSYISASLTASVEFYGVNADHGTVANEFLATGTMQATGTTDSSVLFTTAMNKKFFVGAHRTNYNGTVLTKSDVRLLSFRYWGDYLTDDEIKYHAKDPANFGRKNPGQNSHVWEGNIGFLHVPNVDTLALHWDFDTVTSSATDGTFIVNDITSGSTVTNETGNQRYNVGNYSQTIKNSHPGKGYGFDESSSDVYTIEYIPTARVTPPENLLSSKMIQTLSTDDANLPRTSRPSKNVFAVEASMYDVVSRKMLNFFASVDDFNNQIGAPIHKYREKYKGLEKLRYLFFERVQNTPDVDKFVNLYKWLDSAIESTLINLIPASAEVSNEIRTIIESHVLERNKYRHKFATVKQYVKVDNHNKLRTKQEGEAESSYDYDQLYTAPMHPTYEPSAPNAAGFQCADLHMSPVPSYYESRVPPTIGADGHPTDESESSPWWRLRAERDRGIFVVASPSVPERGTINTRTQLWYNNKIAAISHSSQPLINIGVEEVAYAAGPNDKRNHMWDYYRERVKDTNTPAAVGLSASIRLDALNALGLPFVHDQALTGGLRKYPMKAKDTKETTTIGNLYDEDRLPFSVVSSSVTGGYQNIFDGKGISYAIEDLHHDMYRPFFEVPMQGPFAEENVGGNMYRHGNLLFSGSTIPRKEGFKVLPSSPGDHDLLVIGPRSLSTSPWFDTAKPKGDYLRDNIAKSPVVIKNIGPTSYGTSSVTGAVNQYVQIGNYSKDYEVVHLNGRAENNRYFVLTGGTQPAEKDSAINWNSGVAAKEFALPDRTTGSNKFIFVNKFSNRTGIEGESEAFLDWQSGEYSPYNALPFQNIVVKTGLNALRGRPSWRFGADSRFPGFQSFHKHHRNTVERAALLAETSSMAITNSAAPAQVRDNMWISHTIPQSEINYKWINDSWAFVRSGSTSSPTPTTTASSFIDVDPEVAGKWAPRVWTDRLDSGSAGLNVLNPKYLPLLGFNYSTGSEAITFVSCSDIGSKATGLGHLVLIQFGFGKNAIDAAGTHHSIFHPVDFVGTNQHLYDPITSSTNTLGNPATTTVDTYVINPGLPYQSNWAYGGADHVLDSAFNALMNNRNGPYGWPSWKQIRGGNHPVIRYHKNNNIYETYNKIYDSVRKSVVDASYRIEQTPVTAKHKPILHNFANSMIKYEFGNERHYFTETYDPASKSFKNYNKNFDIPEKGLEDTMLYKITKNTNWETFRYSEVVYPRDENVFKSIVRNKPNYIQRWDDKLSTRVLRGGIDSLPQSQGRRDPLSIWQMDVDNNPASFDISGELMQLDNCGVAASMSITPYLPCNGRAYIYARYGRNYCDCRPVNQVQEQAGTGAFYSSYEKFAADIKLIGQDYSIIPEFKISDYVRTIVTSHDSDFYADVYKLKLTGAYGTAVGASTTAAQVYDDEEFFERLSHTDKITHLENIQKDFGEPEVISLKMSGILKLLPIDGFYPMQRTLQLANEFYQSYQTPASQSARSTHMFDSSTDPFAWRTLLRPFFNPGIMYNTIKSGVAVDYPIIDEETTAGRPETGSYTVEYKKRLPFEAILEPDTYTRKIKGSSSLIQPQDLIIYDWDPDAQMTITSFTGALQGTDGVYEKAAHNFFAETINFFVADLTSVVSSPEEEWAFQEQTLNKKWAMDIVVDKSSGFTMHDAVGYFGHKPYRHHTPAWYPLKTGEKGAANNATNNWWAYATGSTVAACSGALHAAATSLKIPPNAAHAENSGIATITFDPSSIYDVNPEKFFSGKFTYEDVIANSTIAFKNKDRADQLYGHGTPAAFGGGGMPLSASLNLFQKDKENRWVISTKFETPILNFANVDAEATGRLATGSMTGDGSTGGDPYRGMWHQYGEPCTGSEGLWLRTGEAVSTLDEQQSTGSLREACGFTNEKKRIGTTKPQKELREAVVAIPFYIDENKKEKFFDLPLESFEQAYSDLAQAAAAQSTVKKKGDEYVLTLENSISDMISKMRKYNMMPQYDFVHIRDKKAKPLVYGKQYEPAKAPFVMYIFEFSNILSKTDLRKIWQGVLPEIGKTAQKQEITIRHPLKDGELLSPAVFEQNNPNVAPAELLKEMRWKIFKIKRRAANNYFEMLEQKLNLPENTMKNKSKLLSADYGVNWPYDFCSLVEFGKLEASFDFDNKKKAEKEEQDEKEIQDIVLAPADMLAGLVYSSAGTTSDNGGHVHEYEVDANGNGIAFKTCHPESDQICHSHKIVNNVVLPAQSACYPKCKQAHGAPGAPPHDHMLELHVAGTTTTDTGTTTTGTGTTTTGTGTTTTGTGTTTTGTGTTTTGTGGTGTGGMGSGGTY